MYTHLIISGGGIKGAAIIGALKVLNNNKLLDNLEAFIGSSAGGLICFLLNIGYTCDELKDIILNINFNKFQELCFTDILTEWGLDNGNTLMKLVISIAKQKNISHEITFKQLYQHTQQLLVLTGSELNKNNTIYYNYLDFPDMKVLDAVRITVSYPIIFSPILNSNEVIVDGALFSPYPMDYFKNIKTKIGINVHNRHKIDKIKDCEDYLLSIIQCLQERYEKIYIDKYIDDTIIIDIRNIHVMDFTVSHENKYKMYEIGMESAKQYLKINDVININNTESIQTSNE